VKGEANGAAFFLQIKNQTPTIINRHSFVRSALVIWFDLRLMIVDFGFLI
jgi:hypothetical protein